MGDGEKVCGKKNPIQPYERTRTRTSNRTPDVKALLREFCVYSMFSLSVWTGRGGLFSIPACYFFFFLSYFSAALPLATMLAQASHTLQAPLRYERVAQVLVPQLLGRGCFVLASPCVGRIAGTRW